MLLFLILGIFMLLAGCYNFYLVFLSRNPANFSHAVGILTKVQGYKNAADTTVGVSSRIRRNFPILTQPAEKRISARVV